MAIDYGKLEFSASFSPMYAFPLDNRSYFETYAEAEEAAKTAKEAGSSDTLYYYGQTICVISGLGTEDMAAGLYYIKPVKQTDGSIQGELKPLEGGGGVDVTMIKPLLEGKVDKKENYDLISNDDIAKLDNVDQVKHTHTNADMLNKIGESEGKLTYNGNVVEITLTPDQLLALETVKDHSGNKNNPHEVKMSQLSDIDKANIKSGYVLTYDETNANFKFIEFGITIGDNGNWVINGKDTNINSQDGSGRIRVQDGNPLLYLADILGNQIKLSDGNLSVTSLEGLVTPIEQLNRIRGLDKNIMEYLTLLRSTMSYKGVVANDVELQSIITSPTTVLSRGDMYIVKESESNENKSIMYIYNGTDFQVIGETNVEVRDFTVNPIDLVTESTGTLPKERVAGYHEHTNLPLLEGFSEVDGIIYYKGKSLKSETTTGASGEGGEGGGTTTATTDYTLLNNLPQINGVELVGNKSLEQLGVGNLFMAKKDYESATNKGYVTKAEVAKDLEGFVGNTEAFIYYGTDKNGEMGVHKFPINSGLDNAAVQQFVIKNLKANQRYEINSLIPINNRAIINTYTSEDGLTNVNGVLATFATGKIKVNRSPNTTMTKDYITPITITSVNPTVYAKDSEMFEVSLKDIHTIISVEA